MLTILFQNGSRWIDGRIEPVHDLRFDLVEQVQCELQEVIVDVGAVAVLLIDQKPIARFLDEVLLWEIILPDRDGKTRMYKSFTIQGTD